jgi:hypothetical protein
MQRTSYVVEDRLDVTELIERINAERGISLDDTGRHHLLVDPTVPRRRRRLAPFAVGTLTVLVASTVALGVRAGLDTSARPELDAALVGASATSENPAPPPEVTPTAEDPVSGPTVPAPGEGPAEPAPSAAPASARPAPAAAPAPKPAPRANDGVQAATAEGWKLIDRDEFRGAISAKWTKADGEADDGEGRRTPEAISVRDGSVVIRGDEDGATGGMSWRDGRVTGRWEMRAKFPKGDAQFRPVLLLRPDEGESNDGEIAFAETSSASDSVAFLPNNGSDDQESAEKQIDITQWHNYAVEVTSDGVTGYLDGQKWFESTDPDALPGGPVHPAIQLDWFPEGDPPTPTEMLVDWMRIYE